MKNFFTLLVALVITASTFGQSPEKISYQAVVRDATNATVANQVVGMQISILQDGTLENPGSAVYVETQTPTTNANGLLSIYIGGGTAVTGTFSGIAWSNGPHYIKIEIDPSGNNTNYTITGTIQLASVPYALHAKNAENVIGFSGDLGNAYSDYLYWNTISNSWSVGSDEVHIGQNAGQSSQGSESVAIGSYSGSQYQESESVAIGSFSGSVYQGYASVAIGSGSGSEDQGSESVAIGIYSGSEYQGSESVAIGSYSGESSQGSESVAIGSYSGRYDQGDYAIAIGAYSGTSNQNHNSIILNATGSHLNSTVSNSLYIAPIREADGPQVLKYDPITKEVTAAAASTYTVNTFYPELGGYVIEINTDGTHGLVLAMQDQGTSNWYQANDLLSNAANHDVNGAKFKDWRIPTKRELNLMYVQRASIGGASVYWSSTELDYNDAWNQNVGNGDQYPNYKSNSYNVRAVRAF
jgi:hypothetical protein